MSSHYWQQWDKEDLDSWHGKDMVDEDYDDYEPDLDYQERQEKGCSCSSYCMKCLGMSWRDFF